MASGFFGTGSSGSYGTVPNLALLAIVLVLTVWILYVRNRRPSNYPPGPWRLPILGNLHQIGPEPYKTFLKMGEKYGRVFSFDFASYPGVVLNDYKVIRQALADPAFAGRPKLRPIVEWSGGRPSGIVFNDGPEWLEQRRFVLKNLRDFGFGRRTMEGLIQEEVEELVRDFGEDVGRPVSTRHRFQAAVVNSIWRICTGERFSHDDPKLLQAVSILTSSISDSGAAGAFYFFPLLTRLAPNLSGYNTFIHMHDPITAWMTDLLKSHKESFLEGQERDLMDCYLQKMRETTDPQSLFYKDRGETNLVTTLVDLFIAGTETTSTMLSWTLLLLALHPEVQERLFVDIEATIGTARPPGLADKDSLPYTECIMLEVLRFAALIPFGIFHNTTKDVMLDEYFLPKDTLIVVNLYAALRSPVWGDPDVFRPERFLLEDGTVNYHHEAYVPFATGKRSCIGKQFWMSRRDKVHPVPYRPCPVQKNSVQETSHIASKIKVVFRDARTRAHRYCLKKFRLGATATTMSVQTRSDCQFLN